MLPSPCRLATVCLANLEISRILQSLKFRYHVCKSLPLVPVLSQTKSVHAFPFHVPKILFNVIIPSKYISAKWSLCLRCSYLYLLNFSSLPCIPHFLLSHSPYYNNPIEIWQIEWIKAHIVSNNYHSICHFSCSWNISMVIPKKLSNYKVYVKIQQGLSTLTPINKLLGRSLTGCLGMATQFICNQFPWLFNILHVYN